MACASLSTGGGEGTAYTFPMASSPSSSSLPPVSPSSFHPHMSAQVLTKQRVVGSLGTYGAERRRNEGWREESGGVGEREREKLSGKCLSLSWQPEERDGQMDNCYFRLPGKLHQIPCVLQTGWLSHKRRRKLSHLWSRNFCLTSRPLLSARSPFLCGLCTLECSVYSGTEILLTAHKHTQAHTHTNMSQFPGHPCRQSFRALAAG